MADRAHPYFGGGMRAEVHVRPYAWPRSCCFNCYLPAEPAAGRVPEKWLDGGMGWVTRHFRDEVPFNFETETPGRFRCNVEGCGHVVEEEEACCQLPCGWRPAGVAPRKMAAHLKTAHGLFPPPKGEWATDMCDTTGLLEACCCAPCQASRQMMASYGHADTFNLAWCCLFTSIPHHSEHEGADPDADRENCGGCNVVLAAYFTRRYAKTLQNIDEGFCKTCCVACLCPHCSLAQTYREFGAAGVWPGGFCVSEAPQVTAGSGYAKLA